MILAVYVSICLVTIATAGSWLDFDKLFITIRAFIAEDDKPSFFNNQ